MLSCNVVLLFSHLRHEETLIAHRCYISQIPKSMITIPFFEKSNRFLEFTMPVSYEAKHDKTACNASSRRIRRTTPNMDTSQIRLCRLERTLSS